MDGHVSHDMSWINISSSHKRERLEDKSIAIASFHLSTLNLQRYFTDNYIDKNTEDNFRSQFEQQNRY